MVTESVGSHLVGRQAIGVALVVSGGIELLPSHLVGRQAVGVMLVVGRGIELHVISSFLRLAVGTTSCLRPTMWSLVEFKPVGQQDDFFQIIARVASAVQAALCGAGDVVPR